jgi:DNA (cytosine-5)-methyltransferase 1
MSKRPIVFLDLYCGAGGFSTGFAEAMKDLGLTFREIAINHWFRAVETMRANHPGVYAMQMDIDAATPDDIETDVIDHLHASPSCTHHSMARGGKPRSNQLRSQPNEIWKFVDNKHVRWITIENVPEFTKWGPLTRKGKPIKRMEGSCFRAWLEQFTARGYDYEWRILNCADYGDATTRKRFFLIAVKHGCGKIRWPKPTHAEHPEPDLWGRTLKPWRTVSECLDYSDIGKSIFDRKTPLAENTMRRVIVGLQKYCNIDLKPFIVKLNRNGDAESVDSPLSTIVAGGGHHLLCRPFLVRANRGCYAESVERPISSIVAHTNHHALCQPIIIDHFKNGKPMDTSRPLGAQTTHDRFSVVNTFVLGQQGGAELRPDNQPMPTISTAGAIRKVDAVILDMSRPAGPDSGHVRSSKEPMRTITTYDNVQGVFALLEDGRLLDVRIRMLKPSELAAAHSFPKDYRLSGSRADQVKQIGNSVPVRTAKAIVKAIFGKAA